MSGMYGVWLVIDVVHWLTVYDLHLYIHCIVTVDVTRPLTGTVQALMIQLFDIVVSVL